MYNISDVLVSSLAEFIQVVEAFDQNIKLEE